jgi:hypothetical protein
VLQALFVNGAQMALERINADPQILWGDVGESAARVADALQALGFALNTWRMIGNAQSAVRAADAGAVPATKASVH